MTLSPRPPLIITGLSGAGLSSGLKILEDLGFEVFDNFPLPLVDQLLDGAGDAPVAIGIDSRTRAFDPNTIIEKKRRHKAELVFMTCSPDRLQQRFTETRRRHPQAKDRPVRDGIAYERQVLGPLRKDADHMIDTTDLSIHDLRRIIEGRYRLDACGGLSITLMSFGFKHGLPREADIVMDVRFLANPHWIEDLKLLTGHDQRVGDYIEKDESYAQFMARFQTLLAPPVSGYAHEGKQYLTIAIGCTGGRHRSVYVVEKMSSWLRDISELQPIRPFIVHRDLEKSHSKSIRGISVPRS